VTHHQLDPVAAFAELARIDLREHDLTWVLQRVADLAKATIPGAAEVSVSLVRAGRATSPVFTGPLALACDEGQYSTGRGPCLDAAVSGSTVVANDLATDGRRHAVEQGAAASLSVPLPVQDAVTGALNTYAVVKDAFDDDAVELARTFASYGAVAVANAHLYTSVATLAQDMKEAMASRAVIEQAKGILMGQRHCTEQEAFDILASASQRTNTKLRELAESVVRSVGSPRP
jgi:GAF domain-containing protein